MPKRFLYSVWHTDSDLIIFPVILQPPACSVRGLAASLGVS